jgi:hypothetical protein
VPGTGLVVEGGRQDLFEMLHCQGVVFLGEQLV